MVEPRIRTLKPISREKRIALDQFKTDAQVAQADRGIHRALVKAQKAKLPKTKLVRPAKSDRSPDRNPDSHATISDSHTLPRIPPMPVALTLDEALWPDWLPFREYALNDDPRRTERRDFINYLQSYCRLDEAGVITVMRARDAMLWCEMHGADSSHPAHREAHGRYENLMSPIRAANYARREAARPVMPASYWRPARSWLSAEEEGW